LRLAAAPASTEPKRSMIASLSRSAAANRSILGAASTQTSPVQWSTIANTAQRSSRRVQASVGSVAHRSCGVLVVMYS